MANQAADTRRRPAVAQQWQFQNFVNRFDRHGASNLSPTEHVYFYATSLSDYCFDSTEYFPIDRERHRFLSFK
jgi:hypothetical protein